MSFRNYQQFPSYNNRERSQRVAELLSRYNSGVRDEQLRNQVRRAMRSRSRSRSRSNSRTRTRTRVATRNRSRRRSRSPLRREYGSTRHPFYMV